jgi:hypothetical protein
MGKRGPKPKGKVEIKWSSNFAYAIGLIVTDGNLSRQGNRISFVSKDIEQIENFNECLDIKIKVGIHYSGATSNTAHRIQFRDVLFYNFLVSIGITPAKSKTIGEIKIPDKYFFDFLRGCFDGDGTFYSYWDPRWRSSHMFYIEFVSASGEHINWLRLKLKNKINVFGHVTNDGKGATHQLKYAKKEAMEIIKEMYYNQKVICLLRKRIKIEKVLIAERQQQKEYKK